TLARANLTPIDDQRRLRRVGKSKRARGTMKIGDKCRLQVRSVLRKQVIPRRCREFTEVELRSRQLPLVLAASKKPSHHAAGSLDRLYPAATVSPHTQCD